MNEAFVAAVKEILQKFKQYEITIGKVIKVEGKLCEVERTGLATLTEVRLNSIIQTINSSVTIYPKTESYVLVGFIEEKKTESFIIMYSEIDKIEVWFDEENKKGYVISADGVVFDKGENSGIVIAPELVSQLAKLTNRVDTIINAIENGVPVPRDGGVGYQTSMKAILATIVETEDFSNIENERIKH